MRKYDLYRLAKEIDAEVYGNQKLLIESIAPLDKANINQLSFLSNPRLKEQLKTTNAGAIIISKKDFIKIEEKNNNYSCLIVDDVYVAYAKIAKLYDLTPKSSYDISKSAVIESSVKLGKNVTIGANTVISANVIIGDNADIGANCFIGENTVIGSNTKIWSNVSIYHNIIIGDNCLFQANTVIGSDGFGYANEKGQWHKIPQLGSVKIGSNVEVGACTCIDRGALEDTIIEDNVIIDNLCQIAHNVYIGTGTAIAGCTTIAGSTSIGKYCLIGGASVINGHISICDQVRITGMSMIIKGIDKPGTYSSGIPAQENSKWRKTAALTMKIDELNTRIKKLENKS